MRAYTVGPALTFDTEARIQLHPAELPDRSPATGQVSIDVQFAGLGMIDALWASGFMPSDEGFVPGLEVSGTVRALGEGVSGFDVGQVVAAFLPEAGGLAEVACAPAALTAPVPRGLSGELASVIPSNSVTAHLAMTTVSRIASGESVLVHAGVGGLGSQFAQVARMLGAGTVDAVVGTPAKQQAALDLGYATAYLRDDIAAIPDDTYDIVIDPVGGAAVAHGFRVLRNGGRLVKVGNASQADDVLVSSLAHWYENKTTAGFSVGGWIRIHPEQYTKSLQWALDAVARGELQVQLSRTGTWDEVSDLIESLRIGDTTGKLAVRVA